MRPLWCGFVFGMPILHGCDESLYQNKRREVHLSPLNDAIDIEWPPWTDTINTALSIRQDNYDPGMKIYDY